MNAKPERLLALRDLPEAPELDEIAPEASTEMDAAESVWDPWLIALARIQAQEEARPN